MTAQGPAPGHSLNSLPTTWQSKFFPPALFPCPWRAWGLHYNLKGYLWAAHLVRPSVFFPTGISHNSLLPSLFQWLNSIPSLCPGRHSNPRAFQVNQVEVISEMRFLLALTQYDWCPYKDGAFGDRHTQWEVNIKKAQRGHLHRQRMGTDPQRPAW